MLRRLRVYFTGFGLGLLAVYVIFTGDERDLDIWTPEQRILEDIRNDSVFLESERMACYVECIGLSDETVTALWKDSETKSLNPGGSPYKYLILLEQEDRTIEAEIEWDKRTRTLKYIRDPKNPIECPCDD